jgi:hypothetical protein
MIEKYLALIANQHIDKPKFTAFIKTYASACVDIQNVLFSLTTLYDLDVADGNQLDVVGEWIGAKRGVPLIAEQRYFTWDTTPEEGWDNSRWKGIGDPDNEQIVLDDDYYRRYLRSKVLSNIWKGDNEGIYAIFDAFVTPSTPILVSDNLDMTMTVTLSDGSMGELEKKMIISNLILVQPAGVRIIYTVV